MFCMHMAQDTRQGLPMPQLYVLTPNVIKYVLRSNMVVDAMLLTVLVLRALALPSYVRCTMCHCISLLHPQ